MTMWVFSACVSVFHMHASHIIAGNGYRSHMEPCGYLLRCGCRESNPGPLEEQPGLLTTEPSLCVQFDIIVTVHASMYLCGGCPCS